MAEIDPEKLAVAVATAVAAAQSKPDVPAPLKWAAVILSGIAVTSITGMGIWLVSTVAAVQLTVKEISTRLDERAVTDATIQQLREREINSRLEAIEKGKSK